MLPVLASGQRIGWIDALGPVTVTDDPTRFEGHIVRAENALVFCPPPDADGAASFYEWLAALCLVRASVAIIVVAPLNPDAMRLLAPVACADLISLEHAEAELPGIVSRLAGADPRPLVRRLATGAQLLRPLNHDALVKMCEHDPPFRKVKDVRTELHVTDEAWRAQWLEDFPECPRKRVVDSVYVIRTLPLIVEYRSRDAAAYKLNIDPATLDRIFQRVADTTVARARSVNGRRRILRKLGECAERVFQVATAPGGDGALSAQIR